MTWVSTHETVEVTCEYQTTSVIDTDAPSRVLFLDHTASLGGGEIALLHLVRHLNPVRIRPIVALFSDGALHTRLREAGIETHILPLAKEIVHTRKDSLGSSSLLQLKAIHNSIGFSRRLVHFIRAMNVDVVYTNSLKADILGGIAARQAGVPLIWHVRDRIESDYLPASVVRVFRQLCRILPDYVIANSEATLQTLRLDRQPQGAVVYSGIDLEAFDTELSQTEEADLCKANSNEGSNEGEAKGEIIRIGLIGRISSWKGQHIFVQAAAQVLKQFPQARFQIIGAALFAEHEYEAQVRHLVASLDLENRVEFLGFREDIPALMAHLDILVHASTGGEPFGQVVVQGMSASKPVVATRGGGVLEIVVDGVTGLLASPGDASALAEAIIYLLQNPEKAAQMGRNGRRRVEEQFTIQTSACRAEEVIRKVSRLSAKRRFRKLKG